MRSSLLLSFVIIPIVVVVLGIMSFSVLTLNYFIQGLDTATKGALLEVSSVEGVSAGNPVQQLRMTVASRWQDLPESFTHYFEHEPDAMNELASYAESSPFLSPPKSVYFVIKTENASGEIRYVSRHFTKTDNQINHIEFDAPNHIITILLYGVGALALFGIAIFFMLRKIITPLRSLKSWARALDPQTLQQPVPDFQYFELNNLAELIRDSLINVQETLDREKRFLGFASHELRTPLAVMRTNVDLLSKLVEKEGSKVKQQEVLERLQRAGFTMTGLTETLLWLNRQEDKKLPFIDVDLSTLVSQLSSELNYLLHGKNVDVTLTVKPFVLSLPSALCHIVIGNLIRNAFQHTSSGQVEIIQTSETIIITNIDDSEFEETEDLGFGLGLQLTQRLIKQFNWDYKVESVLGGRKVTLSFA